MCSRRRFLNSKSEAMCGCAIPWIYESGISEFGQIDALLDSRILVSWESSDRRFHLSADSQNRRIVESSIARIPEFRIWGNRQIHCSASLGIPVLGDWADSPF